jgi:hypothetical protein
VSRKSLEQLKDLEGIIDVELTPKG